MINGFDSWLLSLFSLVTGLTIGMLWMNYEWKKKMEKIEERLKWIMEELSK